ncbi:twin-arginine translocase TatA/TatE family subunit [Desulfitibacter alkalitolerans]|uniref:twin-arginine translocase TatA/TatE family subunit n=1 Tax=Desulfitibacter alkalitolerans TaxID=264641 RepID=UPI0004848D8B|nr:twin-arginine translocase TatA/TatE family subunit [Desulfitibacter alkalitolerans]
MFGILPTIGPMEIILILIIVLIIFGPGKLPQVGKSLGKAIRDFRGSVKEVEDVVKLDDDKEDKKEKS